MKILGIHDIHNASASLMIDGEIVSAISEERCTYRKNEMGFPLYSIKHCLQSQSLKPDDIDYICFSTTSVPLHNLKLKRELLFNIRDWLDEQELFWRPHFEGNNELKEKYVQRLFKEKKYNEKSWYDYENVPHKLLNAEESKPYLEKIRKDALEKYFKFNSSKIITLDHHTCHAYYAYFASPFREEPTIILTSDGGGDGANATLSIANNDEINEINRNNHTDLARLYRYITLILGMKMGEHEFKVMGLAPYASKYEIDKTKKTFKEIFRIIDNMICYDKKPPDLYFHFRDMLAECRFDGIAGGVQELVEEVGRNWVNEVTTNFKIKRLVFSGGLSMNVKLNQEIANLDSVENFYIPCSGGDESLAIGACYVQHQNLIKNHKLKKATHFRNNYKGGFDNKGIDNLISKLKNIDVKFNVSNKYVAQKLSEGIIVGRYFGGMEFGARALGNRSIIADPRSIQTVKRINKQIKSRDFWMPFAPSIISTFADRYIENPKDLLSDHMTIAFRTKKKAHKDIIAAMHPSDSTVRAHIVQKELNPEYFDLIHQFSLITGVGALLNTSFNLHGFPIVSNLDQVFHVFTNSELDALLIDNVYIQRKI